LGILLLWAGCLTPTLMICRVTVIDTTLTFR
jgi:hypothetical protein